MRRSSFLTCLFLLTVLFGGCCCHRDAKPSDQNRSPVSGHPSVADPADPVDPAGPPDERPVAAPDERRIQQFVRVTDTPPAQFVLDDGTPFVPAGINIGWTPDGTPIRPDAVGAYFDDRFARCEAVGINLVRVWLATWFIIPEQPGHLEALDAVFMAAQRRGIRIILVLDNAHDIAHHTDYHPLLSLVGPTGDADRTDAYFSHPGVRSAFQARCRLLAERYRLEPALAFWELCNEIDLAVTDPIALDDAQIFLRADWIREMARFLKAVDPARRPLTVSVADAYGPLGAISRDASLDFVSPHEYLPDTNAAMSGYTLDEFDSLAALIRLSLTAGKPVLCCEYGLHAPGAVLTRAHLDPGGAHIKHFIWASAAMPFAGPALPWWGEDYIFGRQLDSLWGPLTGWRSTFYPPSGSTVVWVNNLDDENAAYRLTALKTKDQAIGYIRAAALSWSAILDAAERGEQIAPGLVDDVRADIGEISAGEYTVRCIRPVDGELLSEWVIDHTGGSLVIPLPAFSDDIAFGVIRAR